jgi:hypothetical protein
MKGYIYCLLLITSLANGMKKQSPSPDLSKKITKKELLELILHKNANGVLLALEHRRAARVIDHEILKVAELQKEGETAKLSRAGSICLMLSKHLPPASSATQTLTQEASPTHSPSHKTDHRHSSKKQKEHTPAEQLKRMIKKKDLKGIEAFVRTSGVHFINTEAISYAQKKYDLLSESSNKDLSESKEFLILQLLKKYDPNSVKDRRKSYAARSNSKKEERP